MLSVVYSNSCEKFIEDCKNEHEGCNIKDIIKGCMNLSKISFSEGSVRSWANSLPELAKILEENEINKDVEVAVEFIIQPVQSRIDVLICGKDDNGQDNLVIIELKQWSDVIESSLQYHIFTNGGRGEDDYWHPSYQAMNYAGLLKNFNCYIQEHNVKIDPCSFLHNLGDNYRDLMNNRELFPFVEECPLYLNNNKTELAEFIKNNISFPSEKLLYNIEHSKSHPSPKIGEQLSGALEGNPFFSYTEEQFYVVSRIVQFVEDSKKYGERRTVIVRGGPGTGKSIIAINVLGQLVKGRNGKNYDAVYYTQNKAPRNYYTKELIGEGNYKLNGVKALFRSPVSIYHEKGAVHDCGLFDEAHRMYEWKGGTGIPKDYNLIEATIKRSLVSVYFIDEDQAVTVYDMATIQYLKKISGKLGSKVYELPTLKHQFRTLGGNQYINTIRSILGYDNEFVPFDVGNSDYDFKVFDSPTKMRDEIRAHDSIFGKSRLVAGYDYEWESKTNNEKYDIILENGNFKSQWNLNLGEDYSWLYDEKSVDQVGCIHTCQGLDLEYCGVIIGKDMTFDGEKIVFDQTKLAKSDRSSGIRTCKSELAEKLIRNTYNVLLTRGMRGTYVYCEDEKLRDYIRSFIIQ